VGAIVAAVASDPAYVRDFAADYPDGITPDNVRNAIATFERSLVTVDAPFDRWQRGEAAAIGAEARAGYAMFLDYGCASCHQGVGIGGNMYQRLGIMGDYFADRGSETTVDQGRYDVTHLEEDRHVFRVPSLRNVAATAPYFHDGSAGDLSSAVRTMGHYQLGRDLDPSEIEALVAFLESLTGVLPPTAHLADTPS
jgi:cytochrome c peroxidase